MKRTILKEGPKEQYRAARNLIPGVVLALLLACHAHAAQTSAEELLRSVGVKGGLIVHVGCGDGQLTAALRASDSCVVHGVDRDPANVAAARRRIDALGLYGRTSIDHWSDKRLPYTDNLVRLLVCSDPKLDRAEALRVLAPGGCAYFVSGGKPERLSKPRPEDIDDWTHFLHGPDNNPVAADKRVGPPRHLQWTSGPRWSRSHEYNSSLSAFVTADGRLFAIFDESLTGFYNDGIPDRWNLICKDAFSGLTLWRRPMGKWGPAAWRGSGLWSVPRSAARRLVATGDTVFATLDYDGPVHALDAATGETRRTFAGTEGADEILFAGARLVLHVRPDASSRSRKPRIAVLTPDSGEVWSAPARGIVPLSLAAAEDRVFYYDGEKVRCLDLADGRALWTADAPQNMKRSGSGLTSLLVSDGVVLHLGNEALLALDAASGERLWSAEGADASTMRRPDVFAIDGRAWYMRHTAGLDLRTGKATKTVDVKNLVSPGHHPRCYRGKATVNYLMWPQEGAEFVSLRDDAHMRHNWLRGSCLYGVVPANGFLYTTPHPCFCYPGVLLKGFNALSSGAHEGRTDLPPSGETAREKGEAFDGEGGGGGPEGEWPVYRRDPARSGANPRFAPDVGAAEWRREVGGPCTPPVLAGEDVFIAVPDAHRVVCLDRRTGAERWRFTAGGRIDSPPTVHGGRVFFGSADGRVYALRRNDGALVWRFRAAPEERRIVGYGQVESTWPVHGSVLVLDGLVYCTAGRSSFLDGGIHVYALDARTGLPRHAAVVRGPWPDIARNKGHAFSMEGARSDLLVCDGELLYMGQVVMDRTLKQIPREPGALGYKETGLHLSATGGFLDDSGFDRLYWMYARRWPGSTTPTSRPRPGRSSRSTASAPMR